MFLSCNSKKMLIENGAMPHVLQPGAQPTDAICPLRSVNLPRGVDAKMVEAIVWKVSIETLMPDG